MGGDSVLPESVPKTVQEGVEGEGHGVDEMLFSKKVVFRVTVELFQASGEPLAASGPYLVCSRLLLFKLLVFKKVEDVNIQVSGFSQEIGRSGITGLAS